MLITRDQENYKLQITDNYLNKIEYFGVQNQFLGHFNYERNSNDDIIYKVDDSGSLLNTYLNHDTGKDKRREPMNTITNDRIDLDLYLLLFNLKTSKNNAKVKNDYGISSHIEHVLNYDLDGFVTTLNSKSYGGWDFDFESGSYNSLNIYNITYNYIEN